MKKTPLVENPCNHRWPEQAKHHPRRIDTHHPQLVPCDPKYKQMSGALRKYFVFTPPKINIEPENDGLEDDFPRPGVYSQVPR